MLAASGIKRVGIAVASLLGAGLALLLILSVVIPADTVRDAVKAQIKEVTGLDPVLRGDVSVSLFPTGSVRFNDVSLGDNRTGAPALSAQQMLVRRTPGMVPIAVDLQIPDLPIWLTTHRELFTSHRIRAIYDALAEGLDAYINGQHPVR